MITRAVLLIALLLVGIAPVSAQQSGGPIREIIIEGSHRIEQSTVRSYLLVREGDPFDAERIDRSLKSLFATGLFADISIDRQAQTLVIRLVENPIINRIAFEGNQRVEDEVLETEVQLRPRVVFTRTKVQEDLQRILAVYRVRGRFAASVVPKVIRLEQNRVDLVFEIDEGELTKVENIRFVGNRAMDDSDLREVIRTKEAIWYRFFTSDDTYDPDRLAFDRELLRRHYLSEGYADFRVRSVVAELTPERDSFFITFTVDEGQRYKFGTFDISSELRGLDGDSLRGHVEFEEGDWYDSSLVDDVVDKLTDEVGKLGFAFVDIRPQIDRDRENRTISLNFRINEGPRVFVERIDITGNVRTIDKVIRREFRLVEGDAFNSAKLRRSRQRIRNLGYFSGVEIEQAPGSAPDKAVISASVEEQSTGSLSVGAGFSTDAGVLGEFSLQERNLLGRGQELRLSISLAAKRSQIDLGFTEPYFLDREVRAGVDIFRRSSDLQASRSYDFTETGGGVRFGFPLSENLSQTLRYQFRASEIENVQFGASALIRAQAGTRYVSEVSQVLLYDQRDSRISPRDGYFVRLGSDLAGLGGTVFYLRNTASSGYFLPVADEWVLSTRGRVGYIVGLGEDVEIADRYFLGGATLRGFESAGVGPRDKSTDDALGGEWVYNGSVELGFPIGLPNEFGIRARMFTDIGSAGGVSPSNANVLDPGSMRLAVGAGLGWSSPIGPIAIDFGFPILKEDEDRDETIRINFGTRF